MKLIINPALKLGLYLFFAFSLCNAFSKQQLVVVEAKSSSESLGKVYTYEFHEGQWQRIFDPIDCSLGAKGLANGKGLTNSSFSHLPEKLEGDRKTPLGTFFLGKSFGFSPKAIGNFPYHPITVKTEAVDDPQSKYYNTIVEADKVEDPDWQSSEKMFEEKIAYEWGIEILHNTSPVEPKKGSAIFLHVWKKPYQATAGCVAMEKKSLQKLIQWLDKNKSPLLIITLEKKNQSHNTHKQQLTT